MLDRQPMKTKTFEMGGVKTGTNIRDCEGGAGVGGDENCEDSCGIDALRERLLQMRCLIYAKPTVNVDATQDKQKKQQLPSTTPSVLLR